MQNIFGKKRNLTIGRLLLLISVLLSVFVPWRGLTLGIKQIEVVVKKNGEIGLKDSALWVTNLGIDDTKLTVSTKPFDSTARERPYASEVIASGKTVRLDDSLPANFRSSDTLFIRSHEEVATLIAPVDFPVNGSEFYSTPVRRPDSKSQAAPKWVRELGAIGKSGNNVFNADGIGYAPAVKGQTEFDKHYVFGVGVALTQDNSSAEFKLISRARQTMKSLVLSSSSQVYWQAQLGEFTSGTYDFPSRIEMKVLSGTAQGFLSIKDAESGQTTFLPIAPLTGAATFQSQSGDEGAMADGSRSAHSRIGGPMLAEESSLPPPQTCNGGYAYFSNGTYDSRYSSYTYNVYGAPPNTYGTLHIVRNGTEEITPGWIHTDGNGEAQKGPWTPSTNQTGESIYIDWGGCVTSGGDYKIDDVSDPTISSDQTPGFGVAIPTAFSGSGSDAQWGTGFNFYAWSSITATFRNVSTNKYYNGQGYIADYPVYVFGTASPPAGGFSISWSVTPPPSFDHNSTDTYEWCVYSSDYFYNCFECLYFYGPR